MLIKVMAIHFFKSSFKVGSGNLWYVEQEGNKDAQVSPVSDLYDMLNVYIYATCKCLVSWATAQPITTNFITSQPLICIIWFLLFIEQHTHLLNFRSVFDSFNVFLYLRFVFSLLYKSFDSKTDNMQA